MKPMSQVVAQSGLGRMLKEGILCDITINAVGGRTRAHRAVLAVRSPVFMSMFSHDLKEKEQSTVDISGMSLDACCAFISYFYGNLSEEEFRAHRSELLTAADKYDVADLKNACEKSMLDDVDTENVLARLQMAHLHGLPELKRTCARLLVEFRKMYEIPEDFGEFLAAGDRELVAEVLQMRQAPDDKFVVYHQMRQAADDKFVAYHQDVSSKWFGTPTAP
ncbi:BTB/POZ domain-containing protein [Dichanthelium oligosanthes]|uniref:BTB/POZ domain-containing protein n=1 Tax=Dichanthelium oligosanthes TaxID=888268 RepID=A0A1E5WIY5_9POAL|nr:BTB/POZ domain-containing protein [Dichanthelium oligosanthes]